MIDAHIHLGVDYLYDNHDNTLDDLLIEMEKNKLDRMVLYPANSNISVEIERDQHRLVSEAVELYPNKFLGICQVNPHYIDGLFEKEVTNYINQGFKGLSINSQVHGWDPKSKNGQKVFELARKLSIPLFIHIGVGLPLGQPVRLFDLCKEYSDVDVVLVHSGKSAFSRQVHFLVSQLDNIYLETSLGFNMREIKNAVKKYGAERIIMGSAVKEEISHSIYMYSNCGISNEEFEWCTHKTILKVLKGEE